MARLFGSSFVTHAYTRCTQAATALSLGRGGGVAAGSVVLAASVVCFVSIAWRADSVVLRDRKVVLVASLTKL